MELVAGKLVEQSDARISAEEQVVELSLELLANVGGGIVGVPI